jgi:ABC-type Zn uptake system ZnuABC Zn-binding protein ZnuA
MPLVLVMLFLGGCKTLSTVTPPTGVAAITLKLQCLTTDKRYTYFELQPDGALSFAGGFNAINRNAQQVMILSPDQLKQVQQLIETTALLTAKAPKNQDRKSSQTAHYELSLNVDGKHNSIAVNDDNLPALGQLHEMLFTMQAQARYNLPGIGTKATQ